MAKFQNYCSGCGKQIDTYAVDRSGSLPLVFCNSVCRTDYDNHFKLSSNKTIVEKPRSAQNNFKIADRLKGYSWSGYREVSE